MGVVAGEVHRVDRPAVAYAGLESVAEVGPADRVVIDHLVDGLALAADPALVVQQQGGGEVAAVEGPQGNALQGARGVARPGVGGTIGATVSVDPPVGGPAVERIDHTLCHRFYLPRSVAAPLCSVPSSLRLPDPGTSS